MLSSEADKTRRLFKTLAVLHKNYVLNIINLIFLE